MPTTKPKRTKIEKSNGLPRAGVICAENGCRKKATAVKEVTVRRSVCDEHTA